MGSSARKMPAGAGAGAGEEAFFMCECRLVRNFFVRSCGLHFEYNGDDAAFLRAFAALARQQALPPAAEVLAEVKAQLAERKRGPEEAMQRARAVASGYRRLHPEVYTLDPEKFLSPQFLAIVEALKECPDKPRELAACLRGLKTHAGLVQLRPQLWRFPVLSETCCDLLEAELAHFVQSGLERGRPNTMNRYGVLLRELGLCKGLLDPLVFEHLNPVASRLLPTWTEGLDSYKAFTVRYEEAGDTALSQHYDNSEVTLNVNLGGTWTGGQVTFFGLVGAEQQPLSVLLQRGEGVLHAGRELHQAEPVESGLRQNLILWCRSSELRNGECPMCFRPPRVLPANEFAHEGFTVPPCERSRH